MLKTYLKAIGQSFYSTQLYQAVLYHWNGVGVVYLLLVALLLSIISMTQFMLILENFNRTEYPHILKQAPSITIAPDEIIVKGVELPYRITSSKGKTLVLIDQKAELAELEKQDASLVIGKSTIYNRQQDGSLELVNTSRLTRRVEINPTTIQQAWNKRYVLPVMLLPLIVAGKLIMLLLQVALLAVISYLITSYMKEEFPFETRMRLAAIAMTPPLLLMSVLQLAFHYSAGTWLMFALATLYMYVMIVSARQARPVLDKTV